MATTNKKENLPRLAASKYTIADISEIGLSLRNYLFEAIKLHSYISAQPPRSKATTFKASSEDSADFLAKTSDLKDSIRNAQVYLDKLKQAKELGPLGRFELGRVYRFIEFPSLDSGILTTNNTKFPLSLEEAEKEFKSHYLLVIGEPYFGELPDGYRIMNDNALTGVSQSSTENFPKYNMWYQEMLNLSLSTKIAVDLRSSVLYWGKWYKLDDHGNEAPVYFTEDTAENPKPLRENPENYLKNPLPEEPERDRALGKTIITEKT